MKNLITIIMGLALTACGGGGGGGDKAVTAQRLHQLRPPSWSKNQACKR